MSLPKNGTRVTAKRAGWNEELSEEEQLDREPVEHDGVDLEGTLEWRDVPASDDVPGFRVCLVDGQEADPATVQEV